MGRQGAEAGTKAADERRRYELFVRRGRGGIALKHNDEGVGLDGGLLFWSTQTGEVARSLAEVTGVHLSTGHVARHGDFGACAIAFSAAAPLVVSSSTAYGYPDAERNRTYRAFLEDLHRGLAERPPSAVRFSSGVSEARIRFIQVMLVIMGLLMVALPLVLLAMTGELSMLGVIAVGGAFVWGYFNWTQKNAPRVYEPDRIPSDLMP
ncbi:hypothetical protein [Bosea sp. (in: a-proteobacteria)]|uniref:hypothetical protein n=1 Tax=Bosea sp. (in: a-proteobacteria) TaxID=1871050 RepID=UPI002FCB0013